MFFLCKWSSLYILFAYQAILSILSCDLAYLFCMVHCNVMQEGYARMMTLFTNFYWSFHWHFRISAKNLKLTRPSMQLGRYKMIKMFHHSSKPDPDRWVAASLGKFYSQTNLYKWPPLNNSPFFCFGRWAHIFTLILTPQQWPPLHNVNCH